MSEMSDRSILERLASAIEASARSKGRLYVGAPDGKPTVDLGGNRRLVVRDRGATATRGDGVTAVVSSVGDGVFDPGQTEQVGRFDVRVVDGTNVWTAEGATAPTFSNAELADHLLDAAC